MSVPNWGEGRGTERGWSSREDGAGPSALRTVSMKTFLEKHFNKSLSEEEREAILKDFPKPDTKVVSTPKLDFGAKKSLFKIQEQLLETHEDTLLLIQRALTRFIESFSMGPY